MAQKRKKLNGNGENGNGKGAYNENGVSGRIPKKEHHSQLVCTKILKPKTIRQGKYVSAMEHATVTFGIGPAGSGKTALAIYYAIQQVLSGNSEKIIITRPVVEAGEKLGFLPGDLFEKIDPYLKPVIDAVKDIIGEKKYREFLATYVEVAPLAFMRGRTFHDSTLILDEAQNTTEEQMFMFLTRMGMNSKIVVTADPTQIDLQKKKDSGIFEALAALRTVDGIQVVYFNHDDVVRCPMVSSIVSAYTQHRNNKYSEDKIVQEVFKNE